MSKYRLWAHAHLVTMWTDRTCVYPSHHVNIQDLCASWPPCDCMVTMWTHRTCAILVTMRTYRTCVNPGHLVIAQDPCIPWSLCEYTRPVCILVTLWTHRTLVHPGHHGSTQDLSRTCIDRVDMSSYSVTKVQTSRFYLFTSQLPPRHLPEGILTILQQCKNLNDILKSEIGSGI